MAGFKTFMTGLCLGSVTSFVAMQIHVVNTNDGLTVLPRAHRPPVSSTYVDVRKWSLAMWRQHPEVAEAALKSGRVDLLGDGALNSIFPKQAGTDSETLPTSNTANEKAKLAMEALVPIKFTNPDGEQAVMKPNVPDPKTVEEIFPKHFTQQNDKQSTNDEPAHDFLTHIKEVLPQEIQLDESLLNALPKLQRPIPIRDSVDPAGVASNGQTSEPSTEKTDLFTDVLKALIPPKAKEQASTIVPQHSVAHPAYRIQAPTPHSQQAAPRPSQINQQPVVPVVRPF